MREREGEKKEDDGAGMVMEVNAAVAGSHLISIKETITPEPAGNRWGGKAPTGILERPIGKHTHGALS